MDGIDIRTDGQFDMLVGHYLATIGRMREEGEEHNGRGLRGNGKGFEH